MIRHSFDASRVALRGSNLIEASAGTGKTYSIGILVLRLLLEQHMAVENILMVTFTNAAVDELSERIRKFIRMAFSAAKGQSIEDQQIENIVIGLVVWLVAVVVTSSFTAEIWSAWK